MARPQTERAVVDLVINGQQAKTSLKEVSLELTRTRSALNKMRETDPGYQDKLRDMHALLDAHRQMVARINDTSTAWSRFRKDAGAVMTGVVGGNIVSSGIQSLIGLVPEAVQKTATLKDAFADIAKSTGLSAKGVQELNNELKNIDTRTTNAELRDIAIAGGQLGVANNELKGFVENVDKAVVALGDEFTGGVDQVAKEIGGIAKLFDETRGMQIGPAINQIGSALNELGAAGSATSPVVAEFTTRMGQLGNLAPKLAQTLGFGAAFQELGLTAEIASSGLSQLILTAVNKSDLFAQHLKMDKTALENLINTDPNAFLMQLAKSFEGLAPTQVQQRLKELKVESMESVKVMSLLADQTDFVAQKQALAAKAMAEGTSLTSEFDKKNHELARDLKALNEWFDSLLTTPAIQDFLSSAIHNLVQFIRVLPQVGDWLSRNKEYFYLLAGATTAYYGATIQATISTIANTTAEIARRVAYEAGFRWLVLQETATKAYALATGVATGQISLQTAAVTLARGAWSALNAVFLANPIGIVVAGLTALAYAVKTYSDNTEAALLLERRKLTLQRDMQLLTELQTKTLQKLTDQLQDYNTMTQAERAEYVKNVAVGRLELESRLARMKAREKENEMLALEPSLWQKLWATIKSGGNIAAMSQSFTEQGLANVQAVRQQFEGNITGIENNLKQFDNILGQISRYEKTASTATGRGSLPTIVDPDAAKKKKSDAQKDADELERMLAESRQRIMGGEESDYEKEVAAFAQKYTKMYELAKNNQEKIDEIRRQSLIEFNQIDQKRQDKEDEKRRKETEHDNKVGLTSALKVAQEKQEEDQGAIDKKSYEFDPSTGTAKYGEADIQMQKLQSEQQYLMQKKTLEEVYAQSTADTEKELTRNANEQSKLRAETEMRYAQEMKQAEWSLQDAKRSAMAQGVETLKGFLKEGTIAYKAAIVAQKAFAIAQIIIDMQREIAQIWANPTFSFLPDGGALLKTGLSTAARVRAGISIATVVGTGLGELAAKKDGGFTGMQELYGDPSGFTSGPTLFNLGRRSYIAGEAGREFVVSNKALQQPVVADFARMLDIAQKTNNYGQFLAAMNPVPSVVAAPVAVPTAATGSDSATIVAAISRLEQQMAKIGSRPISFDMFTFEKKQEQMQNLRSNNSL